MKPYIADDLTRQKTSHQVASIAFELADAPKVR
jgi:hypothetical protein